jgi:hypothetical protein
VGHGRGEPLRGGDRPSEILPAWARRHGLDLDSAGAREPCFSLNPDHETEEEAEAILKDGLRGDLRSRTRLLASRYNWFDVRLYPLTQDLVGEELTAPEVDEEFIVGLGAALEGLEPRP